MIANTISTTTWYSDGLRWVGTLFSDAADYLDRTTGEAGSPAPMPRHTSYDEVVGEVRNRIHSGFGAGQRPYY